MGSYKNGEGGKKDYGGILGSSFVIKNGGQAIKKKMEVCLELQRGQES